MKPKRSTSHQQHQGLLLMLRCLIFHPPRHQWWRRCFVLFTWLWHNPKEDGGEGLYCTSLLEMDNPNIVVYASILVSNSFETFLYFYSEYLLLLYTVNILRPCKQLLVLFISRKSFLYYSEVSKCMKRYFASHWTLSHVKYLPSDWILRHRAKSMVLSSIRCWF